MVDFSVPLTSQKPWGPPMPGRTQSKGFEPTAGLPSGGGGDGGYRQSSAQYAPTSTTTTSILPEGGPPTPGATPVFNLPGRNQARIKELIQTSASPGIRSQRRTTRMALLRHLDKSPAVRKELERAVLAGHGDAVSKILGVASREGRAQYEQEYAGQMQKAMADFQAAVNTRNMQYQGAMQAYLASIGKTTKTQYSKLGGGSGGSGGSGLPKSYDPLGGKAGARTVGYFPGYGKYVV